jgi:hypothetical protein
MTIADTQAGTQLVRHSFLLDTLSATDQRFDRELLDACLTTSTSLWRGVLDSRSSAIVVRAISAWLRRPYGAAPHTGQALRELSQHDLERIDSLALPDDASARALCDVAWRLLDQHGSLTTRDLSDLMMQRISSEQLGEIAALVSRHVIAHAIYRQTQRA